MLLDNPETVVQSDMPIAAGDQGPSLSQTVKHVDEFSFVEEKKKKKANLTVLQSLFKDQTVLRPIWIPY
jgi:hypothetical protein